MFTYPVVTPVDSHRCVYKTKRTTLGVEGVEMQTHVILKRRRKTAA